MIEIPLAPQRGHCAAYSPVSRFSLLVRIPSVVKSAATRSMSHFQFSHSSSPTAEAATSKASLEGAILSYILS